MAHTNNQGVIEQTEVYKKVTSTTGFQPSVQPWRANQQRPDPKGGELAMFPQQGANNWSGHTMHTIDNGPFDCDNYRQVNRYGCSNCQPVTNTRRKFQPDTTSWVGNQIAKNYGNDQLFPGVSHAPSTMGIYNEDRRVDSQHQSAFGVVNDRGFAGTSQVASPLGTHCEEHKVDITPMSKMELHKIEDRFDNNMSTRPSCPTCGCDGVHNQPPPCPSYKSLNQRRSQQSPGRHYEVHKIEESPTSKVEDHYFEDDGISRQVLNNKLNSPTQSVPVHHFECHKLEQTPQSKIEEHHYEDERDRNVQRQAGNMDQTPPYVTEGKLSRFALNEGRPSGLAQHIKIPAQVTGSRHFEGHKIEKSRHGKVEQHVYQDDKPDNGPNGPSDLVASCVDENTQPPINEVKISPSGHHLEAHKYLETKKSRIEEHRYEENADGFTKKQSQPMLNTAQAGAVRYNQPPKITLSSPRTIAQLNNLERTFSNITLPLAARRSEIHSLEETGGTRVEKHTVCLEGPGASAALNKDWV